MFFMLLCETRDSRLAHRTVEGLVVVVCKVALIVFMKPVGAAHIAERIAVGEWVVIFPINLIKIMAAVWAMVMPIVIQFIETDIVFRLERCLAVFAV